MNKQEYIKSKIQQYYKDKYKNDILNKKYLEKRKEDVIYRIIDNITTRCRYYFNKKNIIRNIKYNDLIGCDKEILRNHLASQFKDNMNFDNYGKWEIDHIKPLSKCNFNNIDEIYEYFNYKNLQPLWKIDNIIKSNK